MPDRDRDFLNPNKWLTEFSDGTVVQYDRALHVFSISYRDGTHESYDASASIWTHFFKDGSRFSYDAGQKAYVAALAGGASYTVTLNGARIAVDASGNIIIDTPGTITMAGGGPQIARIGDIVHVADPDDGVLIGTIVTGSPKVNSG